MIELGNGFWTAAVPASWRLDDDPHGERIRCLEGVLSGERQYRVVDVNHPVYGAAMMVTQMKARQEKKDLELVWQDDNEIIYSVQDDFRRSLYHLRVFEECSLEAEI